MIQSEIAGKTGVKKGDVDLVVGEIASALARGEDVTLAGLGSFKVSVRGPRTGRNPQTGEAIQIGAKRVVKFHPGKVVRDGFAG